MDRVQRAAERLHNSRRMQWAIVAVLTLLGAGLRFLLLGEWSFWIEEHHTLRHTSELVNLKRALRMTRAFYYLITRPFLLVFGPVEWSLRLPAAILGSLTIPLMFLVARRILGLTGALIATLLLLLAPWHVYWSQNARFYTLALIFYLLSLFAFYVGTEKNNSKWLLASGALFVLALASHLLNVFVLLVIVFYILGVSLLRWQRPPGLSWGLVLGLGAVPLVGLLMFDSLSVLVFGREPIILRLYSLFVDPETRTFVGYPNPFVTLGSTVYYIGAPLAVMSSVGAIELISQRKRLGVFLAAAAYLPLIILMLLTYVASVANRYAFMALPFWLFLAAVGVRRVGSKPGSTPRIMLLGAMILVLTIDPVVEDLIHFLDPGFLLLIAAALCLSFLLGFALISVLKLENRDSGLAARVSLLAIVGILIAHPLLVDLMYFSRQHGHRHDWKRAAGVVERSLAEGDVVLTTNPVLAEFYIDRDVAVFHLTESSLEDVATSGKVWLIHESYAEARASLIGPYLDTSCQPIKRFDNFAGGRNYEFAILLCDISGDI